MPSIGVITAHPRQDWHSRRLIDVAMKLADVRVLDPLAMETEISPRGFEVICEGCRVDRLDGLLLTRPLNEEGNPDHQVEIYRLLHEAGVTVMNTVESMMTAIDKFRCSTLFRLRGLPTPRVVTTQSLTGAARAVRDMGRVVIKPVYGSLGRGLRLVDADDLDEEALSLPLQRDGMLYLQEYVEHGKRDIRVFVVDGRAQAAIYRYSADGQWITNISQGGRAEECPLTPELRRLSSEAAAAAGLCYTGVDIVETSSGMSILEVNGVPDWRGIYQATGRDMALPVIQSLLRHIRKACGKQGGRECRRTVQLRRAAP